MPVAVLRASVEPLPYLPLATDERVLFLHEFQLEVFKAMLASGQPTYVNPSAVRIIGRIPTT